MSQHSSQFTAMYNMIFVCLANFYAKEITEPLIIIQSVHYLIMCAVVVYSNGDDEASYVLKHDNSMLLNSKFLTGITIAE